MHEGRVATVEMTRGGFEELTRNLLDRTIEITRRTIETARGKGVEDYDHLVLVGGSTKMPAVQEALRKEFGLTPRVQDPDLAVAKGAALYAFEETYRRLLRSGDRTQAEELASRAGLSADQRQQIANRTIRTVASRSFGIVVTDKRTRERSVSHLVHVDDALPASVTKDFYTLDPNQTGVEIEVVEQAGSAESEALEDNNKIADGLLEIPPGKPEGWPFEVTYALDTSGLLRVTARERETGERLELEIQIGNLSEEEVARSRTALSHVRVS
jgi:molecular chaperone DnaK (HSP70)